MLTALKTQGIELSNYVGSHPMAGREQTGALAGRGDLFTGRPWIITPNEDSLKDSVSLVEALECLHLLCVPPFSLETLCSNFFVSAIQDLHTIFKSKWGPH